jgi:hypothetical protein
MDHCFDRIYKKISLFKPIHADDFGNAQGYKQVHELECDP